jgi:hypothetical protein
MIDPEPIQVLEPSDAVSFSKDLKNHVIKHVFK